MSEQNAENNHQKSRRRQHTFNIPRERIMNTNLKAQIVTGGRAGSQRAGQPEQRLKKLDHQNSRRAAMSFGTTWKGGGGV